MDLPHRGPGRRRRQPDGSWDPRLQRAATRGEPDVGVPFSAREDEQVPVEQRAACAIEDVNGAGIRGSCPSPLTACQKPVNGTSRGDAVDGHVAPRHPGGHPERFGSIFGLARGGLLCGELPIGQVDGKGYPEPGGPLAQRAKRVGIKLSTP